jgi:DNA primase
MEVLAERAGIPLEGVFRGGRDEPRRGPDAYQLLGQVRSHFQRQLHQENGEFAVEAARARAYLQSRGLASAIETWGLGYHPLRQGALAEFAAERHLPREVLEEAGLLRRGREMFAGRLIFPIEDERGRTVGFGGRLVPGAPGSEGDADYKPPKYLNSPESPLFRKRRVLFGLHRAKQAGCRRLVVREGYTDVIACHLAGFPGAVAALGTSFTSEHARMLERYATDGLVLLFDGDRAGLQAAERAMRELVNTRLPVRIALMTEAKDPADYVVARAGEDPELLTERRARFADLLDGAEDALVMWLRLLRKRLDLSQAVHLETAARECATLLAAVEVDVRRAALLQEMARHLGIPAPTLERLLKPLRVRPAGAGSGSGAAANDGHEATAVGDQVAPAHKPTVSEVAELEMLATAIARPHLLARLEGEPFGSAVIGELASMARDGFALGRTERAELVRYLFTRIAERPELQRALAVAARRAEEIKEPAVLLDGLLAGRRRIEGQAAARGLRQQLQDALAAGDHATAEQLTKQLVERMRADRPRPRTPGHSAT